MTATTETRDRRDLKAIEDEDDVELVAPGGTQGLLRIADIGLSGFIRAWSGRGWEGEENLTRINWCDSNSLLSAQSVTSRNLLKTMRDRWI